MKLTFSILWFDDSDDYFGSLDMDPLKAEILSWGFSPEIKLVTTPDQFLIYAPFKEFDLIVVDLDLEQYGEGQDFIAGLRENAVYTEVIFYTVRNVNDLWDAVREKQLEGVFVSHRSNILPKIFRVGRQSIRKVLDLENMRGIVMAEVGEIDHLLDEIIRVGVGSLPPDMQTIIFNKFHKEAAKQNQQSSDRLATFIAAPRIDEMLDMCDSNKRWGNFNRLWKLHDRLKENNRFGDYKTEVLDIRNILAHGKPEIRDGGFLFRHRGKEFFFNDETSNGLRQTILTYKREFSNVLTIVKE
ncbi:hypothetical protein AUJ38_01950 [bacterium CG1_02_42_9]|nr:MAG: hypothetical protein AUJ38_01950 [bacterium CG1_02_42_9]